MNLPLSAPAAARALEALLELQSSRLLRLTFPDAAASSGVLLVANRLDAREALGRDFEFTLELLSNRTDLPLDDWLGKLAVVILTRDDGSERCFSGHVFEFGFVRNDGGFAVYRMVLRPWLAYLRHSVDHRIFHGLSIEEQTALILREYPMRDWRIDSLGDDRPMTDAVQYGESQHNYLHRRWEDKGWFYRYEHRRDGYTLVLTGDSARCPPVDGSGHLPWQGRTGVVDCGIRTFGSYRAVAATLYAATTFDFKQAPRPASQDVPTLGRPAEMPEVEHREYLGARGYVDGSAGQALVRLRIEEIEARARQFTAEGDDDHAEAGRTFKLVGRAGWPDVVREAGDDEFLILEAEHAVANNYLAIDPQRRPGVLAADYRCRFTCIRRSVPWHPGRGHHSHTPKIHAPQTAIVVGLPGTALDTDVHGRVHLQFHWDRLGSSDHRSSAWVRVATPWAGGENGFIGLPRIGSEVIVEFLDGSVDRPIVTGAVYNTQRRPPWRLPAQHALSGLRSRELTPSGGNLPGGRSNHLVLDDTPGRIQVQLKSDHLASQLSLGHVARIEDNAGRKDARGQGFELRTDGVGAIRSGAGLLLTTAPRPNAEAHLGDLRETLEGLGEAHRLHVHLSDSARLATADADGEQADVAEALDVQTVELRGKPTGAESDPGTAFAEFEQPHLVTSSPSGVQSETRGSTHQASGQHHAITSGRHVSIAAGKSLLASAQKAIRLFARNAGIKLVAAGADIDITALKNGIHLLAQLDITQTADTITVRAKSKLTLAGGGSYVELDAAGVRLGTDGVFRAKAAAHRFEGPDNQPPPALPQPVQCDELVQRQRLVMALRSRAGDGRPVAGEPYELYRGDALIGRGLTDALGQVFVEDHPIGTPRYVVKLANGAEYHLDVSARFEPGHRGQHLSNHGYRGPRGDSSRSDDYSHGAGNRSANGEAEQP